MNKRSKQGEVFKYDNLSVHHLIFSMHSIITFQNASMSILSHTKEFISFGNLMK